MVRVLVPEAEALATKELDRLGYPKRRLFLRKLPVFLRMFLIPILFPVMTLRISSGTIRLAV